jgi:hypothetical protein
LRPGKNSHSSFGFLLVHEPEDLLMASFGANFLSSI